MEHYITAHLNEMLTLLAARCDAKAAALLEQAGPVLGRLHLDHGLTVKAESFTKLGAQFKELATVGDSADLIASLGHETFDEIIDGGIGQATQATGPTDMRPGVVHYQPYPSEPVNLPFTLVPGAPVEVMPADQAAEVTAAALAQ